MPSLWLNRVESPSPLYVLLVESAQSLVSLTSPSSSQNVNVCCVGVFLREFCECQEKEYTYGVRQNPRRYNPMFPEETKATDSAKAPIGIQMV